jgi:hypothetical protein
MGKKVFDKIAEGLGEALAIARGEARPAELYPLPILKKRNGERG